VPGPGEVAGTAHGGVGMRKDGNIEAELPGIGNEQDGQRQQGKEHGGDQPADDGKGHVVGAQTIGKAFGGHAHELAGTVGELDAIGLMRARNAAI